MSQWTHVAGFLRIDYMQQESNEQLVQKIKNKLGKTCNFYSDEKSWDDCNVPCGSEGSIQYEVSLTGSEGSLARITVRIWGDLRSYDDDKEIYSWIKKSTKDFQLRAGMVQIDVEYRDSIFYGYNQETDKWNMIKKIPHKQ